MAEVMSIAVSDDDQWLVVNGRPIEYYASDTAFLDGKKVWASQVAATRLAEALATQPEVVDFVSGEFPDAIVTLSSGEELLVHGAESLGLLGLEATEASEVQEEDLVILARELISRAHSRAGGVEPRPVPVPA